jgi:allophanate hydrolase subunit 1
MSFTPGRVRFKVPQIKHSATRAASLRERITLLPGIETVEVNPTTGSVLVKYDKHLFSRNESVAALRQALAKQLSAQEVELLRSWLQSEESVAASRQALVEILSPQELDRIHAMLQALASQGERA